jgi:hypothetical protein
MPAGPTHSIGGTPYSTSVGNGPGWLVSGGRDRSVNGECQAYMRDADILAG